MKNYNVLIDVIIIILFLIKKIPDRICYATSQN